MFVEQASDLKKKNKIKKNRKIEQECVYYPWY